MAVRQALCFGLALTALPFTHSAHAQVLWRHIPGLMGPGHAGMQIGDFDGDGKNELAVTAWGNSDQSIVLHQRTAGPGTPIRRTQIYLGAQQFLSPLLLVHREGQPDSLLTTVVLDNTGQRYLRELSEVPLRVQRDIPVPPGFQPYAVADVDADGRLEVLGLASSGSAPMVSIDLQSGQTAWTSTVSGSALTVLQFDSDPALEIVLSGFPGLVVDGATRQTQVSYPAGFGSMLAVGNFDVNPQTMEFAAGGGWSNFQLFRNSPFSPIGELVAGETQAIGVRDIDGDGVDEIICGNGQWGSIRAFDPISGSVKRTIPNPEHGTSSLTLGDLDGIAGEELAFGAGLSSSGRDIVSINTLSNGQNIFLSADEMGPYSLALLADVDADQAEEAVFMVRATNSGYNGSRLYVLDGATGVTERSLALDTSGFSGGAVGGLYAEQLDLDPALEIGFGIQSSFGGGAGLVDGITLQSQWTNPNSMGSMDMLAVDLNGDGSREVVAVTTDSRLAILDRNSGAMVWNSVALGQGGGVLAVGNIDADSAQELLIGTGNGVYAFDSTTRLLEWSLPTMLTSNGLQTWGSGDDCRIAAWTDMAMVIYRCSDQSIVDSVPLPADTLYARVIDSERSLIAAAVAGRLQIIKAGVGTLSTSPYFGRELGASNRGFIRTVEAGRRYATLFGSGTQVVRYDIDLDDLFRDSFD